MDEWLKIATRRDVVVRGLKVGSFVGTILVAINQGDMLLSGEFDMAETWKIFLTYLVPYCVSTYASVAAVVAQQDRENGS